MTRKCHNNTAKLRTVHVPQGRGVEQQAHIKSKATSSFFPSVIIVKKNKTKTDTKYSGLTQAQNLL